MIPIKGFLKSDGIFTSILSNAAIAIMKAGPRTHGSGNNNKLKITPPIDPIRRVLIINLTEFFILFS